MRCPRCGGIARHFILDVKGNKFYQCTMGLTTSIGEGSQKSMITPCKTIIDQYGNIFNGHIAYVSDGKQETLLVQEGRIK